MNENNSTKLRQHDSRDCGPTCLRMVARHYGKNYSLQGLRNKSFITREGVSLLGISEAAEQIGFRSMGVSINWEQLTKEAPLPCIVHWKQNHFVVVYKISKKSIVSVADPAHGLVKYTKEEFLRCWLSNKREGEEKGIALLLEPGPDFYNIEDEKPDKSNFRFLFQYLRPHKKFMLQVIPWLACVCNACQLHPPHLHHLLPVHHHLRPGGITVADDTLPGNPGLFLVIYRYFD